MQYNSVALNVSVLIFTKTTLIINNMMNDYLLLFNFR